MQQHRSPPAPEDLALRTLLYRFVFFDWLFRDMGAAHNAIERHSAWQHNRHMRQYLPTYLRRWSALTAIDASLGCVFEHDLSSGLLAAWFFTCSCITLTGMLLIAALWLWLGKADWA
jgi:hypothetical protein